ncbi:hypothetical protein F3Y22_tig00110678pilonHSYRG00226 [Hibiscus syriacus]|uniref:Uncharacterized protein n=1 Tax=Hibiscus syriacus TaxID=106335 RepID=A0A6A2ZXS2_HIBSY|nr:hypothetical protein F3Y22_tig00110678pilonHSYRG00226 [Hibiscus syriacus]
MQRSDGGGVFDDLDSINGQRICGCNTIAACQPGAPFGSCKNVSIHTPSPAINNLGSFSGPVQFSGSTSTIYHPNHLIFALFSFPWINSLFTRTVIEFDYNRKISWESSDEAKLKYT